MRKFIYCILLLASGMLLSCNGHKVPTEKDMGAYLFVFFSDPTHSIFFATSRDGYTFTAVNDGQPVIDGKEVAEQKGVRDPHITRGPDGAFYLSMTDLHLNGRRFGYRDTQWQRPENEYGWGNNRSLVLMKSKDLINWTSTHFDVAAAFPELGDISQAWAPVTFAPSITGGQLTTRSYLSVPILRHTFGASTAPPVFAQFSSLTYL